ncbi:TetR/AcrR family transcriptional regulator [Candidatus Solirubrobacter pratensis]|uniref:TetR/AcrR family transcriptional regulator n=1 Tax=Candidatus Solirubrobacter pratensis TaxID=1298857 RepID=UPI00041D5665|nr:TetR/AcrR family transcriptional regulator [Candidatus Solirubrobacter pratensis]
MARPRSKSDEEVLAAALRAVGEHGVAKLTLADVAREAGLAPSTLAERYGSKRALLLAAAKSAAGGVERAFAAAGGDAARSPRGAAVEFLVALAAPVSDRRAFAHHLALLELDVADPEFRAAAAAHVAAVLERLGALGLTPAEARRLYVAYNGALVLWALTGEGSPADALRADLSGVEAEAEPVEQS